jgi:hypothetical protein
MDGRSVPIPVTVSACDVSVVVFRVCSMSSKIESKNGGVKLFPSDAIDFDPILRLSDSAVRIRYLPISTVCQYSVVVQLHFALRLTYRR